METSPRKSALWPRGRAQCGIDNRRRACLCDTATAVDVILHPPSTTPRPVRNKFSSFSHTLEVASLRISQGVYNCLLPLFPLTTSTSSPRATSGFGTATSTTPIPSFFESPLGLPPFLVQSFLAKVFDWAIQRSIPTKSWAVGFHLSFWLLELPRLYRQLSVVGRQSAFGESWSSELCDSKFG